MNEIYYARLWTIVRAIGKICTDILPIFLIPIMAYFTYVIVKEYVFKPKRNLVKRKEK